MYHKEAHAHELEMSTSNELRLFGVHCKLVVGVPSDIVVLRQYVCLKVMLKLFHEQWFATMLSMVPYL